MHIWQTALGFYQNSQTAAAVLHQLKRHGLQRVASIHRDHDDQITITSYRPSAILLGCIAVLFAIFILAVLTQPPYLSHLVTLLMLAAAALAARILILLDHHKIEPDILDRLKKLVIRDETLVIVQVEVGDVPHALRLLRHVESGHPLSFLLRSPVVESSEKAAPIKTPLTLEQMQERASQLAQTLGNVSIRKTRQHPLLKKLNENAAILAKIRLHVGQAEYVEQTITSSAEWLLDNTYVIQGNIVEVRRNLPQKYYHQLPKVSGDLPRISLVAQDLVDCTANRLSQETIISYLNSFQAIEPLTIGELWALPLMLRFKLIENIKSLAVDIDRRLCEGEQASFWGNRLLNVARRDLESLPHFLNALAQEQLAPSPHFAEELLEHLFDDESILPLVRKWLEERLGDNISDIISREQMHEANEQVAFSSAVISLITLSHLSWRDIFETISPVDARLLQDPIQIYAKMDFITRDSYRHAIEKIARLALKSESLVAETALQLAEQGQDEVTRHVGYYLIDAGRPALESSVGCRPTLLQQARRGLFHHPALFYLGSIGLLTLLMEWGILAMLNHWQTDGQQKVILAILALLPLSEVSIQLVNFVMTQILPPKTLPKLSYETGIPEEAKTLVVIPVLLSTPQAIEEHVGQLEIHYLANSDPHLRFGLFFDFLDAPQEHMPEDQPLLESAIKGIQSLESKYGRDKFFLFSRERVWSPSENSWIGWERKRGKLECLNHFLLDPSYQGVTVKVGEREALKGIRYVITLDSDTRMPKDTAKQMIETSSHPLNIPRFNVEGSLYRGYAIIQPRVNADFVKARFSWFARLFSDVATTDPYSQAVSEVYQDLTLEGTYHGKGIYDLRAFHQILSGLFPEEHLLSHDLIEGCYARVAFASDICLLDDYPVDYFTWIKRQHRWMRGDWQIIDWLFSKVPTTQKVNPLSSMNRWKILDNLRRSIVPVALVFLLLCAWFFGVHPWFWTGIVILVLFMPTLILFFSQAISHPRRLLSAWPEIGQGVLKTIINAALLPHHAYLSLDALARVIYRRLLSHRHLLEWTRSVSHSWRQTWIQLGTLSLLSFGITLLLGIFNREALTSALPFTLLWMASPLLVKLLDRPIIDLPDQELSDADRQFLRKLARKTWRYFDDFVGPQSNWLPPDNYQAALLVEVAERTSPTNIGLWMLTVLAAHDLKYVTSDEVIDRILATFETLKKLETYEGHLLNWYDTKSLKPLYPRYVSTVDSGNFLACLWTLEQGLNQLMTAPLLPLSLLEGLKDTFQLIEEDKTNPAYLQQLKTILHQSPQNLFNLIAILQSALDLLRSVAQQDPPSYGLKQLEKQLEAWTTLISRYFPWIQILNELPESDEHLLVQREQIYRSPFTLETLAAGDLPPVFKLFINNLPKQTAYSKRLVEAIQTSQWLAGEKLGLAREIITAINGSANALNMRFLYNLERKLFSIGYHVDDRKLDSSYYDLLASEARIASVVAIAKGDVPVEHWWALGRPYRFVDGQQVLLSWGGTMFEFLMPLLFNPYYPNSLLGRGCKVAVECQIRYGKKRGIPWGISEAAYSEIDARRTYQYRSFGVPGLGLKRGLEDDLVVSPYSTALALAVKPVEAVQNLRTLTKGSYNLLSDNGYYESIDFARQHAPHGERGVIVYAFMAHHEGMSLLAFDNLLNNNPMPTRFHANPRITGVESLLYERIPVNPPVAKELRKEVPISRLTPFSGAPIMGIMNTPHSPAPKVNLLSNGEYSLMVTNSGGGYSRWKDIEISRWRADTTCDCWGSFCYIKDLQTGAIWSTAFHPTQTKDRKYSVSFKADKVEIHRRDQQIETITEIVVSPEDNAEVRLLTLANLSNETRTLELTSYLELALAPHAADRAHPCFNKLFIQTEALAELSGLLAFRRLRSPEDQALFAAHVVAAQESTLCQFETNRTRFIGRGRTLQNPVALDGELSKTAGTVLDPIFSLRACLTLAPGQRGQVAFVTAIADTREKAIFLAKKYGNLSASQRALELAWTHAQLELRHLRIHQEETQLFQKLASRILFPHAQLRPSSDRLRKNRLGQSALWAYGISGDLPIVVISIADVQEVDLVKQTLTAHAFWRLRGLKVDLVILNEQATGYENPLFEQIQRIVHSHFSHPEIGQPGGVYLINCDQISEEDLTLILSVARVNLIAARGSLRQQVVTPMEATTFPSRLIVNKKIPDSPSRPLPFLELSHFNGLGGYSKEGREYVIYLGPQTETPQPWINVIANSQFGLLVSETGLGTTWYGNSQSNRLTPWSNDPLINPISDAIYIRDEELGTYWTPTPSPIRELDAYRVAHGQGYSRFEHNSHGIEQELLVFVPQDDSGGHPLRIQRLRLFNNSPRRRILTIYAYSEWVLGGDREVTQMHVITEWDPESQAIFAYNRYHPDFGGHLAFACSNPLPHSYTASRTEFLGRNGHANHPAALKRKALAGLTGTASDPCAALQIRIELEPQETTDIEFILGYAPDTETARALILKCREKGWIEEAYQETNKWWDKLLGTMQVDLPEPAINFALNRWLLYQVLSCRFWGRSGFYQSSGAYGFRDQLQDVLALLYSSPQTARAHILKTAAHQFEEGDVQHWWHPPSNGGVRTRISDDLLWLPFVTAQYVRVTQDTSILEESVPFLKGELLKEDQHEAYFIPEISHERATLLEHCRRAIYKGITEGPNGLPLIGGGDWNDGMNRVGIQGKGESVWLAWFLIHVLNDFADLQTHLPGQGEGFRAQAKRLAEIIEAKTWDGNWYCRAYFDDGSPLGSKDSEEDTIDCLPQSWAVISGAGDSARCSEALKSVEEKLVLPDPGLVLLLTPPFNLTTHDPGYIKGYPPGVRENGGQYTHGSLWVPMAFARKAEGDKAVNLLRMMHPSTHTQNAEQLQRYKVEPYVLAGDVYALPGQVGRGGWSWYSGSAAWMYRIWLEEILGFTLRGTLLSFNPVLPASWEGVKLIYQHRSSRYEIAIENPRRISKGQVRLELNGNAIDGKEIQLADDGATYKLRVIMG